MKQGGQLNKDQQLKLQDPVTREEVQIQGINDVKAPRKESLNAIFKKSMDSGGEQVINAILQFFNTGEIYQPINYRNVKLIPKVQNPTKISEYRPISCGSITYKISLRS